MNVRNFTLLYLFFLCTTYACNFISSLEVRDLGGGYFLTLDGINASVLYTEKDTYRGTGIRIIKPPVTEVKHNNNYIIASSMNLKTREKFFWIIHKTIKINLNDFHDQKSYDSLLMSNVTGPLDSLNFLLYLNEKGIDLRLK